ncbi:MAG: nucleotide exchange factor GrpE [Gammaproteobacteria bacterium]|nr:nucleotide exchange factor GrpE [Gammaproteobacteria bacterium]
MKNDLTDANDGINDVFSKDNLVEDDTLSGKTDDNLATDTDVEVLSANLLKAEETAEKHWNDLLRARAELDNVRRRAERDVENAHKYAVEKFVQELLPVIDSLEMGLIAANSENADIEKLKEGTELTLKLFFDCVQKFGVQVTNPVGEIFDPEFHQAMSMQESNEHKPNTVLAVMQKGYLLHGRLARPAMVVVSKTGGEQSTDNKNNASNAEQGVYENDAVIGNNIDEQA